MRGGGWTVGDGDDFEKRRGSAEERRDGEGVYLGGGDDVVKWWEA